MIFDTTLEDFTVDLSRSKKADLFPPAYLRFGVICNVDNVLTPNAPQFTAAPW